MNVFDFDSINFETFELLNNTVMRIDREYIDDEMSKHSLTYTYYNGIYNKHKKQLERMQMEFESTCSLLRSEEARRGKAGGGKIPAHVLDDYIKSLPEYKSGMSKIIDTDEKLGYIKAILDGFQHKKDMMVQISANRRSETKLYS
jgi:hypothetical protein